MSLIEDATDFVINDIYVACEVEKYVHFGFATQTNVIFFTLLDKIKALFTCNTSSTLVNVYVALPVFTPVAGRSYANFMEQNCGAQYVNSEFGRYFHFCWC